MLLASTQLITSFVVCLRPSAKTLAPPIKIISSISFSSLYFFEKAIELGAEDINNSDGNIEVITSIDDFENLRVSIESLGHNISAAEISMIPKNSIKIEGKPAEHMLKMMEALEDCDDVQNVYSNFDIDDEIINKINI